MTREIVTLPHPVLRRKALKVSTFDKDFQNLVDGMVSLMREAPGVGLAAPQVAEPLRLIVVEYGEEDEDGNELEDKPKKLYIIANPEIVKKSEEMVTGIEGCLSVPGLIGRVSRHESISVKGVNRQGKAVKVNAKGWLARIFQHEIDHLEGVVFTDLATELWQPRQDEEENLKDV